MGEETFMEKMAREKKEKEAAGNPSVKNEVKKEDTVPVQQTLPSQPTVQVKDNTGAMGAHTEPHVVQLADGVRGSDNNPVGLDGNFDNPDQRIRVEQRLVQSNGVVSSESEFTKELQSMHDEIERLTKEYTEGGLQVSDFPASYHVLTNQYRIKAAALNRVVGGVGPEESKVLKEINEMKAKLDLKLADARKRDAENTSNRRTENQVKSAEDREQERLQNLQHEEMKKKGVV